MIVVSYKEMQDYIAEKGSFEPEVDHSSEEFTSEDFWDKEHTRVIAHTKGDSDEK